MKTEQELANELDAFLTARLKGQSTRTTDDMQAEVRLANALLDMAAEAEPDPVFLSNLEARLARAASRQKNQQKVPERPSFWQQLLNSVEESFAVKRTVFALGTIVALIIVGIFALNYLLPNDGTEPASVAGVPTLATEAIVPTTAAEGTAVAEALPEATSDTSNLPALPALAISGGGGGFGGGGGNDLTAAVPITDATGDITFLPWNPLSGTVYVMNAELPGQPNFAAVYEQADSDNISLEDVRRFANLFRIGGEIYTQYYPPVDAAPGEPIFAPPTSYFMFDGPRTLSAWGTNLQYYDQSAAPGFTAELMPYEQALPIAEAFLRDRGLLDFDYQVVPPQYSGNEVNFHRVIDGRPVTIAEYTVTVTVDGQILSVYYNPLNQLQALGEYPLRSAESAWQQVTTEGVDYQHSYYLTYPGPGFELPQPPVDEEAYKFWIRSYQEGESLDLYTSPQVYQPVESDAAPYIQADQFVLTGSDDILRAIAEQINQQIHLTGTVHQVNGGLTLEVSNWEPMGFFEYEYRTGVIRRSEGATFLETEENETILIPNAPSDLADGEKVNVGGWTIEQGETYPTFNWQNIDRVVEFVEQPGDSVIDVPAGEPYSIGRVEITSVDMIYAYSPIFEEGRNNPRILLQPAWRFKGTTDTNEIIEFVVQAVADEFLTETGQ